MPIYSSTAFATENESIYQRGDSAYGIVSSRDRRGAYIVLDNGQSAYSYGAANVPNNSKVICSVIRPANEKKNCLVRLDSVCGLYEIA